MADAKHAFSAEELNLLDAIHADSKSDTPRLVYANWLEKHGNPEYAEFIRLQLVKESRQSSRARELEDRYGTEWAGPVPIPLRHRPFERGLPKAFLEVSAHELALIADRLANSVSPRLALHLAVKFRAETDVREVLAHQLFRQVAWLHLSGEDGRILPSIIAEVARSPYLHRLIWLAICCPTPEAVDSSVALLEPHVRIVYDM